MATINLISALRLLQRFGDSAEVVGIIDETLKELERLQQIEALAVDMASVGQKGMIDTAAGDEVLKLARVPQ